MNIHFLHRSNLLLLACPFMLIIILPKCIIGLHNSFSRTALMTMLRRCRCHYYAVLSCGHFIDSFMRRKKKHVKILSGASAGRKLLWNNGTNVAISCKSRLRSISISTGSRLSNSKKNTSQRIVEMCWHDGSEILFLFKVDNAFCRNTQNVKKKSTNLTLLPQRVERLMQLSLKKYSLDWLWHSHVNRQSAESNLKCSHHRCVTASDDRNALAYPKMYPVSLLSVDHFNMRNCRRHINRDKKSSYRWTFISCSYKTAARSTAIRIRLWWWR